MSRKYFDPPPDVPEAYKYLPQETKNTVQRWISWALVAVESPWWERNGYGLKHDLEYATGVYLSEGEFLGLMMETGHLPANAERPASYCVRWSKAAKKTRGGATDGKWG